MKEKCWSIFNFLMFLPIRIQELAFMLNRFELIFCSTFILCKCSLLGHFCQHCETTNLTHNYMQTFKSQIQWMESVWKKKNLSSGLPNFYSEFKYKVLLDHSHTWICFDLNYSIIIPLYNILWSSFKPFSASNRCSPIPTWWHRHHCGESVLKTS